MRSFKIEDLEGAAQVRGSDMTIPDGLLDVLIMDRMHWDEPTLRATPEYTIKKLLILWHIQSVASKADSKKASDA